MSKNILEIKNLSIMFGGIVALDDVNMTTKKVLSMALLVQMELEKQHYLI